MDHSHSHSHEDHVGPKHDQGDPKPDHSHTHSHGDHSDLKHDHGDHSFGAKLDRKVDDSGVVMAMKYLSTLLISFLPEHLQDSILDVDDALVLTGIIALTLVSICVPYFIVEGFFSVRPLRKKVVELNNSLWKVRVFCFGVKLGF